MKLLPQTCRALTLGALALCLALQASAATETSTWVSTRTRAFSTNAAALGAAVPATQGVRVAVALKMRNEAALDAFIAAQASGSSRARLTPQDFLARHAPTVDQVQAVVDHLRSAGFSGITVSPNRMLVTANGTAAAVQTAFRTTLRAVTAADGRLAYANDADAQVPARFASSVNAVLGLQNVERFRSMMRKPTAGETDTALSEVSSRGRVIPHAPKDFATLYDADGLAPATGSTIAIMAEGDISQTLTDLAAFAAAYGYPQPNVSVVLAGPASTDTQGVAEWNLDSQVSLAVAGGQIGKMVFYVASSLEDPDIAAAFTVAVADNAANTLNASFGECEIWAQSSGMVATIDAALKQAVAQGQTFSVASGDFGAMTCLDDTPNGQAFPATSPYAIAVGGTRLAGTGSGINIWASEKAWSCSGLQCIFGGTGGGPSVVETAPAWQISSGVLGKSTMRGIPDIAFSGDPASGAIVRIKGQNEVVGGTSLSAPLFTGFWARIQSAYANTLSFPAPFLYQVGVPEPSSFHDVVKGTNSFPAKKGWDYTTGFGSLHIGNFKALIDSQGGF